MCVKLSDLLAGGPGLNGYAYQAALYCVQCGEEIIRDLHSNRELPGALEDCENTEVCPVPVYFGEGDHAEHCEHCGEYLYGPQEDQEQNGPEDGDYTTTDHVHFYQYGKLVLTVLDGEDFNEKIAEHMNQEHFYPECWFISDHGNAHKIDIL